MMRKPLAMALIALLITLCLTGCDGKTIYSEQHTETSEAAVLRGHTGLFTREVSVNSVENYAFLLKFIPKGGQIRITITDCNGKEHLTINENATLPKNGAVTVAVPSSNQPYVILVDMTHFSGEYEISWEVAAEASP
ncbi:MAG: hypothetical protein Q4Q53_05485 [Methanocorpusculum sp.]|nr:hypothetical protein [Methanocorpusculum sp.]